MQIHSNLKGETVVKLTKTESETLRKAQRVCAMIQRCSADDGASERIIEDVDLLFEQLEKSKELPLVAAKPY